MCVNLYIIIYMQINNINIEYMYITAGTDIQVLQLLKLSYIYYKIEIP